MTRRTQRRDAELAVIEAARLYYALGSFSAKAGLGEALARLEVLNVDLNVARTGNDNPCLTSSEAAEWMAKHGHARDLAVSVLRQIWVAAEGLTTEQIEEAIDGSHQSISPRVTELRDLGLIEAKKLPTGEAVRRTNRSGRKATVWVVTPLGESTYERWDPTPERTAADHLHVEAPAEQRCTCGDFPLTPDQLDGWDGPDDVTHRTTGPCFLTDAGDTVTQEGPPE